MLSVLLPVCYVCGTDLVKETYVFNVTDRGDTLRLDRYPAIGADCCSSIDGKNDAGGQVLLFAFGGGFKGGQRDHESFLPLFRFLVENGVTVVSTDYRTTLGGVDQSSMASPDRFKEALYNAISTAVKDFYSATAFVAAHAREWGISADSIVACGSSAGAITVLQAEYGICNGMVPGGVLPDGFNYSGVIAMAGAVCSHGAPVWENAPARMLLFHGDADAIVPFRQAVMDGFGLWGSQTISNGLQENGIPHRFHIFRGRSHEIAGLPMTECRGEILDFIKSLSRMSSPAIIVTDEKIPGTEDYRTGFTIEDYIRANL